MGKRFSLSQVLNRIEAKELAKKGVYPSFEKAMRALKRGHVKGRPCPITRRPFHEEKIFIPDIRHPRIPVITDPACFPGSSPRRGGHWVTVCSECFQMRPIKSRPYESRPLKQKTFKEVKR